MLPARSERGPQSISMSLPASTASRISIRPCQPADWPAVWEILRATLAAGDTLAFAPDATQSEMRTAWIDAPLATYVACEGDAIIGTYFIKANQPGLGSHVCNAGYVVAAQARGKGAASVMCRHSQAEAQARGFRAMQFNIVVSTNEGAVRLWQQLGFRIVGTLPGAFRHLQHGYVDAHVMFKDLTASSSLSTIPVRGDSMARKLISSGSPFEQEIGYSRAVVDGKWVFVSGTTGFDYATMQISDDVAEQAEQCLKNIDAALREAGSSLKDVVRVTYILPDGAQFRLCWPVTRKYFDAIRPAATMISAGLADPRMKIEIEVTARKPS
jgi:enamine deaminase RidA (YjgF/YER057c/UK114 family)/ribosomal protein S18 acetylase RimI-like enzyme